MATQRQRLYSLHVLATTLTGSKSCEECSKLPGSANCKTKRKLGDCEISPEAKTIKKKVVIPHAPRKGGFPIIEMRLVPIGCKSTHIEKHAA